MSTRTARIREPRTYILAAALLALAAGASPASAFPASVTPAVTQEAHARDAHADSSRLVDRLNPRRADRTLVTREGDFALMVVGPDLYIQLTDRGLEDIGSPDDEDDDASLGSRLILAMLRGGIRELLDHAIAYPIAELDRAEYVDGRLVLEDHEGKEIMGITLNDRDVLTDFRPREAQAFARELRRRMRADN